MILYDEIQNGSIIKWGENGICVPEKLEVIHLSQLIISSLLIESCSKLLTGFLVMRNFRSLSLFLPLPPFYLDF